MGRVIVRRVIVGRVNGNRFIHVHFELEDEIDFIKKAIFTHLNVIRFTSVLWRENENSPILNIACFVEGISFVIPYTPLWCDRLLIAVPRQRV